MNKKYSLLLDDTKIIHDEFHEEPITLHRIIALRDILYGGVYVKAGNLGGYIESEENLSHEDNCWVDDDACVFNHARVYDNAYVGGNCVLENNSSIYGDAYIDGDVLLLDNARIHGDVYLHGCAIITDNAEICGNFSMEPHGCIAVSEDAYVTEDGDIMWVTVPSNRSDADIVKTFFKKKDGTYGSEIVSDNTCTRLDKIGEKITLTIND